MRRSIAVPLCMSHPDKALQYVLEDAGVTAVVTAGAHAERMARLAGPLGAAVHAPPPMPPQAHASLPSLEASVQSRLAAAGSWDTCGALIVYTSGTTGNPKGALHTHGGLQAQVASLRSSWAWRAEDRILHVLPLHHIHGVVNALYCALASGACVEFAPRFSAEDIWGRMQRKEDPITVFMGVPTMYSRLLDTHDTAGPEAKATAAAAAARLRLAVSGSAACPEPVLRRWADVAGSPPLERYGMTETGMILGNPLVGERRPGTVGVPFPGVEVKVRGEEGGSTQRGAPGEVLVRGAQLFAGYWGRPEATAAAFDPDGFFLTGDVGVEEGHPPYIRLLGRASADVLKRDGYKISALRVEAALLEHEAVAECAVVGVSDGVRGQAVAAVVAVRAGKEVPDLGGLREWAAARLPPYELPTKLEVVPYIPRNAMGKVNKRELAEELFGRTEE
jgi:malonyl-CoA/methylmalonyl-CoA synthetase